MKNKNRPYTLVIADDHPITTFGLNLLIEELHFELKATFTRGLPCLNYLIQNQVDIAILDLGLPDINGLDIIEDCNKHRVKTKLIVLTMNKSESAYYKAIQLGVSGYLLKDEAGENLKTCITQVAMGRAFNSVRILDSLVPDKKSYLHRFSKAHQKVLRLMALNKNSEEIAAILQLSKRTVENHKYAISQKINLNQDEGESLTLWVQKNVPTS